MRDYAKIAPKFWTGGTGRAIRKHSEGASEGASMGLQGALMALYLMSSPHSNMLGLYYQPILYAAHETGLGIEGAWMGLRACIDAGFCQYDQATEMVWVHEMAAYQIGEALKPTDKRCAGVQKDYDALPDNPFLGPFFDRYQAAFNLSARRAFDPPKRQESGGPLEAPSKPHRSQEQEQEQEQDICAEQKPLVLVTTKPPPEPVAELPLVDGSAHPVHADQIELWRQAYPAVDVLGELRRMAAWLAANPRKRKTPRGINAFIVAWLTRSQDRPRPGAGTETEGDAAPWDGAL